jgi:hypothetical protein
VIARKKKAATTKAAATKSCYSSWLNAYFFTGALEVSGCSGFGAGLVVLVAGFAGFLAFRCFFTGAGFVVEFCGAAGALPGAAVLPV